MIRKNKGLLFTGLVLFSLIIAAIYGKLMTTSNDVEISLQTSDAFIADSALQENALAESEAYTPTINPAEFTTTITNPFFSMPIGKKMVYETETEDGIERIEILIPGWTKMIMGITTLVYWDRVYLDGKLIEDTRDYIAQDKAGNVWYFGENVDNYVDDILLDHHGAWIGGFEGALPGIWMKADPKVGEEYRQEYFVGEAEDMGRIDAIGVEVTVPAGSYDNCVKIFEWSPLESATAYKYHCQNAGAVVLEEEEDEQVQLVELDLTGANCIALPEQYRLEGVKDDLVEQCDNPIQPDVIEMTRTLDAHITEEVARKIALKEVPGKITDVAVEKKFGKLTYVVEVDADNGSETDVIIDMDTGEILGIEE